ncbi:MAG: 3-dehydroquinate synthase [Chlamydiia bacterium]|nr:3-dehydroquinate synthase [Chlamydiia bacterium]
MQTRLDLRTWKHSGPTAIITDRTVAKLYGNALAKQLNCPLFSVAGGEECKTRASKEMLENALFTAGFGSDVTIIALGGGVVSDMAGFVAATFCRGAKLIVIPTTLLAMCDAAIGGKNGVNIGERKNAIGTYYQPDQLLIDPHVLHTLPDDEYLSGTAEILKHGLIWDQSLWQWMLSSIDAWQSRDLNFLERCIAWNIEIKRDVIAQGKRDLLNFGHTVGHALEMMHGMKHGMAIAKGMWLETLWSKGYDAEIEKGLIQFGFDLEIDTDFEKLWSIMQWDKKRTSEKLYAVSLKDKALKEMTYNGLYKHLSPAP